MKSLLAETEISKVTVCGVKVGKSKLFWKHWTKSDHKHLTQSHFFSLRTRTLLTRFGTPFWEKVEFTFMTNSRDFIKRSRDFITSGRHFITNGRDFHDEWSRFSGWTV